MQTRVGTRLGRYEIVAELGRGAMGAVYKARDPNIDRVVAIKTISLAGQNPDEELEYRERFFLEARAAGRLSHPGIVTIYDMGEEPDTRDPYIVMEFVNGRALSDVLHEKKKLPVDMALQLAQELAEALHCAHGEGVIQRDIKPANILLTEEGHVKIADFGIAKLNQTHLTLPGEVLGSPAYMAPEQLSGEGVDARSDLFSLGVILYSMLAGFRPFQGNSATTVCFKVVNNEPVPVSALEPDLPPALDHIVSKAMAKNPSERYQTGAELARDLQQLRLGTAASTSSSMLDLHGVAATTRVEASSFNVRAGVGPAAAAAMPKGSSGLPRGFVLTALMGFLAVAVFAWFRTTRNTSIGQMEIVKTSAAAAPTTSKVASEPVAPSPAVVPQSKSAAPGQARAGKNTKKSQPKSTEAASAPAKLQITIEHHFAQGQASVWVDNRLIYKRALKGQSKGNILFRTVDGSQSVTLPVQIGSHQVHVRVQARDYDQSKTINGNFVSGKKAALHVACDKHHNDLELALN